MNKIKVGDEMYYRDSRETLKVEVFGVRNDRFDKTKLSVYTLIPFEVIESHSTRTKRLNIPFYASTKYKETESDFWKLTRSL